MGRKTIAKEGIGEASKTVAESRKLARKGNVIFRRFMLEIQLTYKVVRELEEKLEEYLPHSPVMASALS